MHEIQQKILELAKKHDLGSLSLRKIGELIGQPHPQQVKHHFEKLVSAGLLKASFDRKVVKRVDVSKVNTGIVLVPIFGSANAGPATIFADEALQGYLHVSKSLLPKVAKKVFAVRVSGNSMNKAKVKDDYIEDGDYVIIDAQQVSPKSGSVVLSTIDDVANIKRLVRDEKNGQIILASDSKEEFAPIYINATETESYRINGTVVGLFKNHKSKK
jgi:SOS-response transcriptional repressor LexA